MKPNKKLLLAIGISGVAQAGSAWALEPASVKVMGAELVPTVTLGQRYYDNYLYQSADEIETGETVLSSKLGLGLERSNTRFNAGLTLDAGRFSENDADDYDDYGASAVLASQFTLRNLVRVNYSVLNTHERRGTGYSEGRPLALGQPDTLRQTRYGILYRYGANTAKGRVELEATQYEVEYTSREDVTAARNRASPGVRGAFFLRMGGATDALIEVRQVKTEYDITPSGQVLGTYDSNSERYYLGVDWRVTGKSEGSLRFGQAIKDFDSPLREDNSSFSWELTASWSPKTYSTLTFATSRAPIETNGTGNYIDARTYELDWKHLWSPRMKTTLGLDYRDEDYVGSDIGRSQAITGVTLSADYELRRWFDVGIAFRLADKSATIEQYEYSANMAEVYASWSL